MVLTFASVCVWGLAVVEREADAYRNQRHHDARVRGVYDKGTIIQNELVVGEYRVDKVVRIARWTFAQASASLADYRRECPRRAKHHER
ncbi:hypothetical protein BSR47_01590 [Bradyrhizobium canariense]|nr:hypothetical protein BSR47_01590 [Bradyrhizobium canariense]